MLQEIPTGGSCSPLPRSQIEHLHLTQRKLKHWSSWGNKYLLSLLVPKAAEASAAQSIVRAEIN